MTPIDPLAVAALVTRLLDQAGIRYAIGGSIASSIHGEPRSTLDVDIMIDANEEQVRRFASAIESEFYVDAADASASIRSGRPFNAIHFASALKIDLFPADDIGRGQLDRAQPIVVRPDLPPMRFYSPEDLVVRKLLWFREGGEVSSRQWRDVVSMLKTRRLISVELRVEADRVGVGDLLARAAEDADRELPAP